MIRRLAYCVGLNYPGTAAELSGCVNDMLDWRAALEARGYTVWSEEEPTKERMVAVLKDMLGKCHWGDRFVFTYSGHGSWRPDGDGDEADGRDEVLCPSDFAKGNVLSDDELFQIFGGARAGVRRMVISDSCFSGSVTRMLRHPSLPGRAKFLPPAMFLTEDQIDAAYVVAGRDANSPPRKGTVLISGCRDDQVSYDASFNGRANGAFTYNALLALAEARNVGDWHRRIRRLLPNASFDQEPVLTAAPYQRLWSPV